MSHDRTAPPTMSRRRLLTGAAAVAATGALAGAFTAPSAASAAARDGYGLRIVGRNENGGRLQYFRFATDAIEWDPAVNVLLPDGYHTSGKRYPVLYLLHGGRQDFRTFHLQDNIINLTAGREIIVVMPDASTGWYSNAVSSNAGPRNWETFHMAQLLPWIEANFRTFPEYNGRAVAGFSMGGFGALKYTAKYYGHFCSVSSHSGPASLRRDFGLVVHWANATSAAFDLGGGTVYGAPLWDEARVSADNPVERIESYRNKRIFLAAGTSPDPINWFDQANEGQVLAGQREFRSLLDRAGIPHEWREVPGGHYFRHELFVQDLAGMLGRLRRAG
ncbi:esterase family protein [Micromonospora tulbaghiae]|uniref:alpha/beta hydrolase n=1 Tax=Micromonospora tulbaghiae TaxID=479978 RepID=UPI0033E04499